jgi:hypothetical protein
LALIASNSASVIAPLSSSFADSLRGAAAPGDRPNVLVELLLRRLNLAHVALGHPLFCAIQ